MRNINDRHHCSNNDNIENNIFYYTCGISFENNSEIKIIVFGAIYYTYSRFLLYQFEEKYF